MAKDILRLLDDLEASVRLAFLASLNDIKNEVKLATVIRHLETGNIDNALAALRLDEGFFAPFDEALRAAYIQGGANALAGLPVIPDPFPVTALLSASTSETREPRPSSGTDLPTSSQATSSIQHAERCAPHSNLASGQEERLATSPWTWSEESTEQLEDAKEV